VVPVSSERQARLETLEQLRENDDIDPFPHEFDRSHSVQELVEQHYTDQSGEPFYGAVGGKNESNLFAKCLVRPSLLDGTRRSAHWTRKPFDDKDL